MGNTELYKGQTDGIILYILSKGDRHTDELKQIIDEKFSTVKIGTIYSIISRLKLQKLITEYRASSLDGSRRKYYKLTEMGLRTYNDKYFDTFDTVLLDDIEVSPAPATTFTKVDKEVEVNEEIIATNTKKEEIFAENDDKATSYASYISETTDEDIGAIDFSDFEEENSKNNEEMTSNDNFDYEEVKPDNSADNQPLNTDFIPYLEPTINNIDNEVVSPANNIFEKDYDSVINPQYDYKSVLDKLFPKPKVEKVEIFEENTVYNENIELNSVKPASQTNWNDVYELAERDGIKIRVSSDTNRYQGSKILINRLNTITSIITLSIVLLGYLLLTTIFSSSGVSFNFNQFYTLLGIFGAVSVICLLGLIFNPHKQIKDLPRFVNVFEIAIIIMISTIIITFAISAIVEIDYKNMALVFDSLILPSVMSFSLPLFFIIEYSLSKLDFFQSY